MRRFTQLCLDLDQATGSIRKIEAMVRYFREVPPGEAATALHILLGRIRSRVAAISTLREWATRESGLPDWLVDESREHVGDLAEAIALMLPDFPDAETPTLTQIVDVTLPGLRKLNDTQKRNDIVAMWRRLDANQRWVWNKLLTGGIKLGVSETLVSKALAQLGGVDPSVMAQRLQSSWNPTAAGYLALIGAGSPTPIAGHAYPFSVISEIQPSNDADLGWSTIDALGEISDWQAEWMWDGIRAQVVHRHGRVMIWTSQNELVTDRFAELHRMGSSLPDGVVIEGAVLAWRNGRPGTWSELSGRAQTAVGPSTQAMLWEEIPVVFMTCDLLEFEGRDLREQSLEQRRLRLEALVAPMQTCEPIVLSPLIKVNTWSELDDCRAESRKSGMSGITLRRRGEAYGRIQDPIATNRVDWWNWKAQPIRVRAILIGAQIGTHESPSDKRNGLFNEYTFGVLDASNQLINIGRAVAGSFLSDTEVAQIDTFVRTNATGKFGPLRTVPSRLVFELAADGIEQSTRHRSGFVFRNPRVMRWCRDCSVDDVGRLESIAALSR